MKIKLIGLVICFLVKISFAQDKFEQDVNLFPDSLKEKSKLLISFLELKPADTVVDIGSGALYNILTIANSFPNTVFYCEDIDSSKCNIVSYRNMIEEQNYINILDNNIHIIIGNETSTTLPTDYADYVFLISTLHEISEKLEIIKEIKRILKPGGYFLLEDGFTREIKKKHETCANRFMTILEMEELMSLINMELIKDWKITSYQEDGHDIDAHRRIMLFKL